MIYWVDLIWGCFAIWTIVFQIHIFVDGRSTKIWPAKLIYGYLMWKNSMASCWTQNHSLSPPSNSFIHLRRLSDGGLDQKKKSPKKSPKSPGFLTHVFMCNANHPRFKHYRRHCLKHWFCFAEYSFSLPLEPKPTETVGSKKGMFLVKSSGFCWPDSSRSKMQDEYRFCTDLKKEKPRFAFEKTKASCFWRTSCSKNKTSKTQRPYQDGVRFPRQ